MKSRVARLPRRILHGQRLTWNVGAAAAAVRKQADVLATLGRGFVDLGGRVDRRGPRRRVPVDVDELLRLGHDLRGRFQGWPQPPASAELPISRRRSRETIPQTPLFARDFTYRERSRLFKADLDAPGI